MEDDQGPCDLDFINQNWNKYEFSWFTFSLIGDYRQNGRVGRFKILPLVLFVLKVNKGQ